MNPVIYFYGVSIFNRTKMAKFIVNRQHWEILHQAECPESWSPPGNWNSVVDDVWKRWIPVWPVVGNDCVVSPQLFAERSHENGICVGVDTTVLDKNIRFPRVRNVRQQFHLLSENLYHSHGFKGRINELHVSGETRYSHRPRAICFMLRITHAHRPNNWHIFMTYTN